MVADNFRKSRNKLAYIYKLTPAGIEEKAKVTARFLKARMAQYESIKREIEVLKREVGH